MPPASKTNSTGTWTRWILGIVIFVMLSSIGTGAVAVGQNWARNAVQDQRLGVIEATLHSMDGKLDLLLER